MKEKTCFFTGHRRIEPSEYGIARENLRKAVIDLIDRGVIYFGCGGAIGFDTLAAETVLEIKKRYPQIKLIMIYPCKNQDLFWDTESKNKYARIKTLSDKCVYVSKEYNAQCMHTRNRHMVDCSSYCICYYKKGNGGTAYTVEYAKRKGLTIINTANPPYQKI